MTENRPESPGSRRRFDTTKLLVLQSKTSTSRTCQHLWFDNPLVAGWSPATGMAPLQRVAPVDDGKRTRAARQAHRALAVAVAPQGLLDRLVVVVLGRPQARVVLEVAAVLCFLVHHGDGELAAVAGRAVGPQERAAGDVDRRRSAGGALRGRLRLGESRFVESRPADYGADRPVAAFDTVEVA